MFRSKFVEVELSRGFADIRNLEAYQRLDVLVRLHGSLIGPLELPVSGSVCPATKLARAVLSNHTWAILKRLIENGLERQPTSLRLDHLLEWAAAARPEPPPSATRTTVVVFTDQTVCEQTCLEALARQSRPADEILLVHREQQAAADSSKPGSARRVRSLSFPGASLAAARNRALQEATGEIVAFTDAACAPDPLWLQTLVTAFAENPEAHAVVGLTLPRGIESEGQELHAEVDAGAFAWSSRWFALSGDDATLQLPNERLVGCGRNLALRRPLSPQDPFDPELDTGGSPGASDLGCLLQLLLDGRCVLFDPNVLVTYQRAETRREALQQAIARAHAYGIYLRAVQQATERRPSLRQKARGERRAYRRALWLQGLRRQIPWRIADDLRRGFEAGWRRASRPAGWPQPPVAAPQRASAATSEGMTMAWAELRQPLAAVQAFDGDDSRPLRLIPTWRGRPIGTVDLAARSGLVGPARLRHAIANQLRLQLLWLEEPEVPTKPWRHARRALEERWLDPLLEPTESVEVGESEAASEAASEGGLSADARITVVIATHDRPADLHRCLQHLTATATARELEIIVVDNSPCSGLTPPVVAQYPAIRLLSESRQGSSYARNAGILHSTGEVIVTIDDDVVVSPDWLEKLLAPLRSPDVSIVTGNVLPLALETEAQRLFEHEISLSAGFRGFEVDREQLAQQRRRPVLAWEWGTTANAAFRTAIFRDPEVGLMDETLGPGTPAGAGEDPYLLYRAVRAGYRLCYEPEAYVLHKHRETMPALDRQVYSYAKSSVCYYLTTFFRHGDRRSLRGLLHLLLHDLGRGASALIGRFSTPPRVLWHELLGHAAAPYGLLRSHLRVRRLGRSWPHVVEHCAPPERLELFARVADSFERRGWELREAGNLEGALRAFETANRTDPASAPGHHGAAVALGDLGRFEEAEEAYSAAIAAFPRWGPPLCGLADLYLAKRWNRRAGDLYRRAVRYSPNHPWAHLGLGRVLAEEGKKVEAARCLRRAIDLKPDEAFWYERLENLAGGQPVRGMAESAYRMALSYFPDDRWCCTGLGNVLSSQGRVSEAIPYYEEAVKREIARTRPHLASSWNGGPPRDPHFVITGFARSGTTSLFRYLQEHPRVLPVARKEPMYFNAHYRRGPAWYRAHFPSTRGEQWRFGEASSRYVDGSKARRRLLEQLPEALLIVLVRDPTKRAYSDYQLSRSLGLEPRGFAELVEAHLPQLENISDATLRRRVRRLAPSPLASSVYWVHLEDWLQQIDRSRLVVLRSEDLFADAAHTTAGVFERLGLEPIELPTYPQHNKSVTPPMDEATRLRLTEFYRPHSERLEHLLGRDLGWT